MGKTGAAKILRSLKCQLQGWGELPAAVVVQESRLCRSRHCGCAREPWLRARTVQKQHRLLLSFPPSPPTLPLIYCSFEDDMG